MPSEGQSPVVPPQWKLLKESAEGAAPAFPAHGSGMLGGRLFNRDISWLAFNERVLEEAADPSVPALERLRFCAIFSSNLDEFFMVRVADAARLARRSPSARAADGLSARRLLGQVRERVLRLKARQAEVFKDIVSALQPQGIEIIGDFARRGKWHGAAVRGRLPEILHALRRSSDPLPPLTGAGLYVFVRFDREYAVLWIRERDARLLRLPGRGRVRRFALVERWLSGRCGELFPEKDVVESFPFKILRDADLRYRPDDEESLEEQIQTAVERRRRARIVRLEVDSPGYSEGAMFLASSLGVDSSALYRFDLPLDLRTLAKVADSVPRAELRYPVIRPVRPVPLREPGSILPTMRGHDILLHHPYDTFDVVLDFLRAAARDRRVQSVFHTLYRTSRDSPVAHALMDAAARGKRVTVYVEIKARFDESNNLRWAEAFRRAGVRVLRPLGGFKVHSKLTQVLREEDGGLVSYAHLGTGNYHPGTARQYTDLGLLTCEESIGREVAAYCEALSGRRRFPRFRHLLVAPGDMHGRILSLIRRETAVARDGGRGHIIAKMNSLVDPETVEALYEASAAGVKVELLVRGICCLRPGMKGLSENIRVLSIVDRFLEHSRAYYFLSGGERRVYLSSADWMPRNFHSRYEVAFPILDPRLKRYVREVVLGTSLADNVKAWELRSDGLYSRVRRPPGVRAVRSQFELERLARTSYRGTALEGRI